MIVILAIYITLVLTFLYLVEGNAQFYYHLSGATHGPFSSAQIEAWWRDGYFPSDMLVSEDPGMSMAVPVDRLFPLNAADRDEYNPVADYSDDEDTAYGSAGFSISDARQAAQKLASMDVKAYKAKASELATDVRYAAQDSLVKAKEISSMLSVKVADKFSELKQKVKESTGQATPGYHSYQHQNRNSYNSMYQGSTYPNAEYAETPYRAENSDTYINQGDLSAYPQQSETTGADQESVTGAHGDSPSSGLPAPTPAYEGESAAWDETQSYPSVSMPDASSGAEESWNDGREHAWGSMEVDKEWSDARLSIGGIDTGDATNINGDNTETQDASLPAIGRKLTDTGGIAGVHGDNPHSSPEADLSLHDYENLYQPWGSFGHASPEAGETYSGTGDPQSISLAAEQLDQHYARRMGQREQEQQWYNPYPEEPHEPQGQGNWGNDWSALGSTGSEAGGWLVDDNTGAEGYPYTSSYTEDSSDDEDNYAGILEREPRSLRSRVRRVARRTTRKLRRALQLGGNTRNKGILEPASAAPGHYTSATGGSFRLKEDGLRRLSGRSSLAGLMYGTKANIQVAYTAIRCSPGCTLLLMGALASIPILLLVSLTGIPAAIRQLVVFTSADVDVTSSPDGIIDGLSQDSDATDNNVGGGGGGLVHVIVRLLESTPLIRDFPSSKACIRRIVHALEATPTCLFVLLLIQRVVVLALTAIPALLSTMESSVGTELQRRRDDSRAYPDPLDSVLWCTVGKLRFRRLVEAVSMSYIPVMTAFSLLLVHQAMARIRIYTKEDQPLALPEFTQPLQVTLICILVEGLFVLMASLKQHAVYGGKIIIGNSPDGVYSDSIITDPSLLASRDSSGAFPSLLFVLMLNSFVRIGKAHESQGGRPWSVIPVARKLLAAEIRRARRLMDESHEGQHGFVQGALSKSAGAHSSESKVFYKPYSHSPFALSRRGMYSLAVFTSTLIATASCLRVMALHDHLRFSLVPSSEAVLGGNTANWWPLLKFMNIRHWQLPLNGFVWLLQHFGKTLFVGLSDPDVSPIVHGFNFNADRGLYLGINILLAALSLVPITLWTAFVGAVVRYQNCDDELLALSAAVKAPIPSSLRNKSQSKGRHGARDDEATTSFRAVVSTNMEQPVKVVGRVNLLDARAILEAVAKEVQERD